jgi:hypothetical protein
MQGTSVLAAPGPVLRGQAPRLQHDRGGALQHDRGGVLQHDYVG